MYMCMYVYIDVKFEYVYVVAYVYVYRTKISMYILNKYPHTSINLHADRIFHLC